ncbi:MAG: PEGA domain-containing protein, partial [Calditrichia bacterium]
MKKYLVFSFLFMALLFSACTVKEGELVNYKPQYGSLLVNSLNFKDARIFLDHKDTGHKTPALLENVSAGQHVVHLFLSNSAATPDSMVVEVEDGKQATLEFEINRTPSG